MIIITRWQINKIKSKLFYRLALKQHLKDRVWYPNLILETCKLKKEVFIVQPKIQRILCPYYLKFFVKRI